MEASFSYVAIALVVVLASVLLLLLLRPATTGSTKSPSYVATSTPPEVKRPIPERKYYTAEEVAKHNSADDCWLIVEGKVYDVTPYVNEHPGGYAILNNAGKDSTAGFLGDQHPIERVREMVEEFYIGELQHSSPSQDQQQK